MTKRRRLEEIGSLSDVELVERTIDSLSRRDPELCRVLLMTAVPRVADIEMLQALIEPRSRSEFPNVVRRLAELPFVRSLKGKTYSLSDDVRLPILSILARDRFEGRTLADLRSQVLDIWEQRYDYFCQAEDALDEVRQVIKETCPDRLVAATRAIRSATDEVLVEMVWALPSVDHEGARARFDSWFNDREESEDFVRCELMARAFAEAVMSSPEPDPLLDLGAWANYYRFRAALSVRDIESATEWLDSAESECRGQGKLLGWILSGRSNLLSAQFRLLEAQKIAESLIELNSREHFDVWNEHVAHECRAAILERRWRLDEAASAHNDAINTALAAQNINGAISSRLALVETVQEIGKGIEEATRVIAHARLKSPSDTLNRRCSEYGLVKLGAHSPRLLTIFSQQIRLLGRGGGEAAEVQLLSLQAECIAAAGLPDRGVALFDRAIEQALVSAPSNVPQLRVSRAALLDDVGRAAEAASINLDAIDDPLGRDDPWHRARCLTNASTSLLEVGEAKRVLVLAEKAREIFDSMANDRAATLTWLIRADANCRLSRIDEANRDLENASGPLPVIHEVDRELTRSRVFGASGRRSDAAESALAAYTLSRSCGTTKQMLKCGSEALGRLSDAGRLAEFRTVCNELSAISESIVEFGSWDSTKKMDHADAHLAEGLRIWKAGIGSDGARVIAAAEHYAEALKVDAGDGWIYFEAGLLELSREHGRKAAKRYFESALEASQSGPIRDSMSTVIEELTA